MTSKDNKKASKGGANSSINELKNLDLENLSAEQIRELMEKVSEDLSAAANSNEEIDLGEPTSSPRPPWIHFS